jgi:small subunit ribosomal protein S3
VGQKVHPLGFRTGVYRTWNARWFAKKDYKTCLLEDFKLREYLNSRLGAADLSAVNIDRAGDNVRVELRSARPGVVIGKRGQEIEQLRADLSKKFGKSIDVSVQEEKNLEQSAQLVAKGIADQIERRVGYKRLMKKAGHATMKSGARGIKIRVAGRLGGAEIARIEWLRLGCVPLHTLRSDIDYALVEAKTTYGIIGVQVWICRGEYASKKD